MFESESERARADGEDHRGAQDEYVRSTRDHISIIIYILEGYEWLITSSPAELDTEGLFRVPGGQTEILKLKDIFDKGRPLTRVKRRTPHSPRIR